jgi:hypothetical protein
METLMTKATLKGSGRLVQTVAALARLLDQTMNEVQALDSEVREELGHSAESLRIALKEAERNAGELQQLREATIGWGAEKESLLAECERARATTDQNQREHERALSETDEAASIALERQISTAVERVRAQLTARWEEERAALLSDRNRAQQRLADIGSECEGLRLELEKARQTPAPAASNQPGVNTEAIQSEVARVQELIQGVSLIVEDSETDLSVVIRKNVERAELESYLRGLRFKSKM